MPEGTSLTVMASAAHHSHLMVCTWCASLDLDKGVMACIPHYNGINRIFTVLNLPMLPLLLIPPPLSPDNTDLVTVFIACSPECHRIVSMWDHSLCRLASFRSSSSPFML